MRLVRNLRAGLAKGHTYEMIVNARTAELLGLSIPNSILISAGEVIE